MDQSARIRQLEDFIRQIGYQPPAPIQLHQPYQYQQSVPYQPTPSYNYQQPVSNVIQNMCPCGNPGFTQCYGMSNGVHCKRWHCQNCMRQAYHNGQPAWFCNGCYNYHHNNHRRHHGNHHGNTFGLIEFIF